MSKDEIEQKMIDIHHKRQLEAWKQYCKRHNKRVDEYNKQLREEAIKELKEIEQ